MNATGFKTVRNWNKRFEMYNSLKHEVNYTFSEGIRNKQTFSAILARIKERVYDSEKFKKIGTEYRANLAGYISAEFDNMHRLVTWVHWYNGEFVGRNLKYGEGFNQDLVESAHVYTGTEICYNERKGNN